MPLLVALVVVVVKIGFLGRLDMAKNVAFLFNSLALSFYQFTLSSSATIVDEVRLAVLDRDRSSELTLFRGVGGERKLCSVGQLVLVLKIYIVFNIISKELDIEAQNFVAKNISFVNTAGANAGQAVALRSIASNDAHYKCSFEGYQYTLYVRSGTKLFYECNMTSSSATQPACSRTATYTGEIPGRKESPLLLQLTEGIPQIVTLG
ncbi:probable pectinesterase/pectinesterase inhibitor 19 [Cornus florida]|uniref:probable pectinesterase/pectinesterase inhibitor 19 n=1 Tax=Cornus florida TaxID=4283 RepID=UPI002899F403|nr:probable pectinesterase/pectinesterase inhibitor 19 [Cornus florida]